MDRTTKAQKVLLFLVNPFVSAITSFRDIRDGYSHKLLYCWFVIFGIGFCAVDEAADSFRYVEIFNYESHYTWSKYLTELQYWFSFKGNTKDVYTLTVNFLVGQFTDNYHWTYFIYAIVFGYFYVKSLKIFLKYSTKSDWLFYPLLVIFCFSNPIYNINGVRFYTSAWIGVFVGLKLFVEKDTRYLPLLILMPIIHGSSVIWVVLLAIAWFTKWFQNIWIVLFIASSFISAITYLPVVNQYSDLLPQFMQNQIVDYTESERAIEQIEGHSVYGAAYAELLMALPGYLNIILCYLLIFNKKYINLSKTGKTFFTVFLSLSATTNFLSSIPSVGRFHAMVIPFMVIVLIQNGDILKKYKYVFYMVPLIYAYWAFQWIRGVMTVTELWLYILPAPFTVIKYLL